MLICLICGILIGYVYDFFRAVRITAKYNGFFTLISDLFFWIIAGSVTTAAFFYIDGMNLRFYRFCTLIIGVILYFSFLSPFFLFISEKFLNIFVFFFKILFTILKFCGKIINMIFGVLLYPFVFLGKLISGYTVKLFGKMKKFKKIFKRV